MATLASNNAKKTRGRPFKPGNNMGRGRPQGSRNKATIMLEKIMAKDGEAVVQAVISAAKEGDMQAAKLVLDRVLPPRKGRPVTLALPSVRTAENLQVSVTETLRAMADGEISPEEAAIVTQVLEAKRKALELDEFERRLSALENRESDPKEQ